MDSVTFDAALGSAGFSSTTGGVEAVEKGFIDESENPFEVHPVDSIVEPAKIVPSIARRDLVERFTFFSPPGCIICCMQAICDANVD